MCLSQDVSQAYYRGDIRMCHFHRGTLRVGGAHSSLWGPTHGSKFPLNANESGILILFPNFASGVGLKTGYVECAWIVTIRESEP